MNQTVIMAIVFSILIIGLSILLIKFWIESINENAKEEQKNLTPSKYPDGFICTRQWRRWHFDDTHQKICVLMENMKSTLTFSFSQIKDVSVLSDMTSMQNGSPVGRAIVGVILAGGIGAIIGVGSGLSDSEACKSLKVRVTLFNDQFIDEPFIAQPVKTSSAFYRNICASCSELCSTLSQAYYTGHPDIPNPVEESHIDLTQEISLPDDTSSNQ